MIHRKNSDNKKEKENTKKYNFQGKYARSIRWFDLDYEWLEENFRTCEPYFYKRLYQKYTRGHETKKYSLFVVPIGNSEITKK